MKRKSGIPNFHSKYEKWSFHNKLIGFSAKPKITFCYALLNIFFFFRFPLLIEIRNREGTVEINNISRSIQIFTWVMQNSKTEPQHDASFDC